MPAKWVRVYTRTQETDGSTILPYSFAKALSGQGTGVEVQACAQVGFTAGYDSLKVCPSPSPCVHGTLRRTAEPTSPPPPPYTPPPSVGATPLPTVPMAIESVPDRHRSIS